MQSSPPSATQMQRKEQPIYIVQQSKKRALLPKIGSILLLSIIFYVGILVNVSLLDLTAAQETSIKLGALLFLLLIVTIGIIVAVRRASLPYQFYPQRLVFNKSQISYSSIRNTTPGRDLFDKALRTYSINLDGSFVLRNIPQKLQLSAYLQQLIQYAQRH